MWGLRASPALQGADAWMFPTHVGIAREKESEGGRKSDVPYACGDCAWFAIRGDGPPACSLRMWGLRVQRVPLGGRDVMFPTHVGIARQPLTTSISLPHVPYACGDCARRPPGGHGLQDCSLRMWGLRARPTTAPSQSTMFPTHVGIARRGPVLGWSAGYVPYACGDCAGDRSLHAAVYGCSLRMWGLRGNPGPRACRPTMFPTHVGIAREHA